MTSCRASTSNRSAVGLALVATWFATGGNFLAFKGALEGLPPAVLLTARLLLAAGLLLIIALIRDSRPPSSAQVKRAVIAAMLLLVIGQGAIVWGVQFLPAGRTAVFASSAPLFLAVFTALRGEPLTRRSLAGICLGLTGLAMMTAFGGASGELALGPIAIVLAGSAVWALGSLYVSRADLPRDTIVSGGVQMLAAGLIVLPAAVALGEVDEVSVRAITPTVSLSLAYLAVIGLALGYSLFAWLDRATTPALANTFQYVSPVIALAAGAAILGERVTILDLIASAIALSGVALMVSVKPRPARSATKESKHGPGR